jgi:chromosome partitioning protein
MKVVSIASPKGGVGKSTVTALLAATAANAGHRVAIIDLNEDQASLVLWWTLRGEPKNPYLVQDLQDLGEDIAVLAKSKFEFLFIDTPPLNVDLIEAAVSHSDVVLIPSKPSVFDLAAIEPLVEICKARHKPHAILLSDVDTAFKTLNTSAMKAYLEIAPIFEARVSHRSAYANALTNGQVGPEIDRTLVAESQALWAELVRLCNSKSATKSKTEASHG